MISWSPFVLIRFKEAADQVTVFSHVCDLKSNSWLHADRTYDTMATMCHHPAQWADHHRASLFLVRWTFFGVPTKAKMKDLPLVVTSVQVCLLWICQTPEIKSGSASGVVCVWVNVLQLLLWYMVSHPNSFTFQTNSNSIYVVICEQSALLQQEHMETKAHRYSRHNPTFSFFKFYFKKGTTWWLIAPKHKAVYISL